MQGGSSAATPATTNETSGGYVGLNVPPNAEAGRRVAAFNKFLNRSAARLLFFLGPVTTARWRNRTESCLERAGMEQLITAKQEAAPAPEGSDQATGWHNMNN